MITKLQITFPANLTNTPLTYRLIKEFDLKVNILKADIDYNNVGHMLYEINGDRGIIESIVDELETIGLTCQLIRSTIEINNAKCTHCGVCTSICLNNALTIGEPHWDLVFEPDRCIGCNYCISVCPSQAIFDNSSH